MPLTGTADMIYYVYTVYTVLSSSTQPLSEELPAELDNKDREERRQARKCGQTPPPGCRFRP